MRSADAKIARACFDILRRHGEAEAAQLIIAALGSRSDIVLSRKAAALIGEAPAPRQPALYRAALRAAFGVVRTIGARGHLALEQVPVQKRQVVAARLLIDTQASARTIAIAWISRHDGDARLRYHDMLAAPSTPAQVLRVCLTTLGALRCSEDAERVRAFLLHPLTSVRAAAYHAWFKIAEKDKDTIAAAALADPARRIRTAAFDMVNTQGAFIAFPAVLATLTGPQDWALLLRFAQLEKWNWLEAIARLAPGDGELRAALDAALKAWLRAARSCTRPTVEQAAYFRREETMRALNALAAPGCNPGALVARDLTRAGR